MSQAVEKVPTKPRVENKLRLPHPYLTTYFSVSADGGAHSSSPFRKVVQDEVEAKSKPSPIPLEPTVTYTNPEPPSSDAVPPQNNNTPWARTRRAPLSNIKWTSSSAPAPGNVWLITYFILVRDPDLEIFRLNLHGAGSDGLAQTMSSSMLCYPHPLPSDKSVAFASKELVVSRSAFWQSAGSPFAHGPWTPGSRNSLNVEPSDIMVTTNFPDERVHSHHPRRPAKPAPGTVVYSRYIPDFDENFSLIAIDHSSQYVDYFHKWQNDPRVAKAWNQTGTWEEHRDYLKKQHEDPHQLTVMARFDDQIMGYFELYWAKEDTLGAYYDADAFDRGRHTLIGDNRYRGRGRGWWPSIIHYLFLDHPRTEYVVGEPAATNDTVLMYDLLHGLSIHKYVDFPHKRAYLVKVSREWFFSTCPLYQRGGSIAGSNVPLPARL